MSIDNKEGLEDFNVVWAWERGSLQPGLTAVLRVKDEARSMAWVLPPLLEVADRTVLVDNQSTDGTADVARAVAEAQGAAERLRVFDYPFDVSRCGGEHLATPATSVHSLTHFYNWAFAHVDTTYSMKWDGDMVLTREGVATLRALVWQLQAVESTVSMPRHPLFVESDRVAYLDLGRTNVESWIYPMGSDYVFDKAFEWELRRFPARARQLRLPEGLCFELKYLDGDEFAHWTEPGDFAQTGRTERKRREWEVFSTLRQGGVGDLESVVRIESPKGVHVVEHVRDVWLPRAPRPLVRKVEREPSTS